MKLEVGMYVRTDEGIITKIIDNRDNVIIKTSDYTTHLRSKVIKASYNIIDLIEVGDYVNGSKVIDFMYSKEKKRSVIVDSEIWGFDAEEIKSIVTKEQFKSVSYKVERVNK